MRLRTLLFVFVGCVVVLGIACSVDFPDRTFTDGGGGGGGDDAASTDGVSAKGCGNGKLDPGEKCDTAIAADKPGACPTVCDDGLSCTSDTPTGAGTCQASCAFAPITQCKGGDGCCPTGCTPSSDSDCSKDCGNGKLDLKETCDTAIKAGDPGACPTRCDDGSSCTTDELLSAKTCSAQCRHTAILVCKDSDGCCPAGCTSGNDNDCSPGCGNGVLDSGEKCDTSIGPGKPGACPQSCSDGKACTTDNLLSAGTCNAQCNFVQITQCKSGDNCCPTGCNNNTDKDCSVSCGNGVLEGNEKCDTAIGSGSGKCPTSCNDGKACTKDTLLNPGTCDAQCSFSTIQQCKSGDGCCPSGCNANNDNDCSATCGNGVVESGEKCDTAISSGSGKCPTSCNDGKACTNDALVGGGCSAECTHTNISSCTNGDGCCPSGCNATNDNDCSAVCGNGVVESGEKCDRGISSGSGRCPTSCSSQTCKNVTLQGTVSACTAECVVTNKTNGSTCTNGRCYGGSCCTGCWTGSSCVAGTSNSRCGDNGASCSSCSTSNQCKTASCSNQACVTTNKTNGTSCSSGSGKCRSGSCCTGCWDGSTCRGGGGASLCGDNGDSCVNCPAATNACEVRTCTSGVCGTGPAPNGTSCTNGVCYGGSCCTGCWDGSTCRPGFTDAFCGDGGLPCSTCGGSQCCNLSTRTCEPSGGPDCLIKPEP